MKRRNFLIFSSLLGLTPYIKAKTSNNFEREFQEVKMIITSVQEHLFPENNKIPSSKSMSATMFLFETISHKSYDKDISTFVLEGAKKFELSTEGKFLTMSTKEREKALRDYESTRYGKNWLSRIMIITMEGIFGDPIYGSNKKELGWRALHSFSGKPRAKSRYIEL